MTSHYEHRILHTEEKQFLSPEAQSVAYHHFLTQEVSPEIIEKAVLQAQILSNFGARAISGSLFAEIINSNVY